MVRIRRMFAVAMMAGMLVAVPFVSSSWSGDPDMPGVEEHDSSLWATRCAYLGDWTSCLIAWFDYWLDSSLL